MSIVKISVYYKAGQNLILNLKTTSSLGLFRSHDTYGVYLIPEKMFTDVAIRPKNL